MTPPPWLVILVISFPFSENVHHDVEKTMFHQITQYIEENPFRLTSLEHNTVFQKVGTVATDLAFGHIDVPLQINHLALRETIINNFNDQLQNTTIPKKMKSSRRYHVSWLKNWSNDTATGIVRYIDSMLNSFETDLHNLDEEEKQRVRRQIVAAGVGAIVASIVTLFEQSTLEDVVAKKQTVIAAQVDENLIHINQNSHDIQFLNQSLNEVLTHLYWMEEDQDSEHTGSMVLQSTYALGALATQTEKILKAIELVKNGHFSTDLATPEGLEKAIIQLKKEALKSGRTIAVSNLLDLSLLPASYLYNATSRTFHAIVHIPFATQNDQMDLYKYIPTPIKISNDSNLYASITNQDNTYLAVSSDGSKYKTFSVRDIQECTRFQNQFYCPNAIYYKTIRPSCLVELHKNNLTSIRSLCELTLDNQISDAIRINEASYIIIETQPTELTIRCQHGFYDTQMIQGVHKIDMISGCTAFTKYLTIKHPRFEPTVRTGEVLMNNRLDATLWFDKDIPTSTYLDVAQELMGQVGRRIPLKDVHHLAKFRNELASIKGHGTWPSFFGKILPGGLFSQIMTFVILTFTFFIGYKFLMCYCNRRIQLPANNPPNYQQAMELGQLNASHEPLNPVQNPNPVPNNGSHFWRAVSRHLNNN